MRPASTADSLSRQMIENLESENAFLKEQIAFKDKELSDCHDLIKKLTHQNEILTQIRQSVEPNLPLDGEAAQQEPATPAFQDPDGETLATDQPLSKTEIIAEAKRLHREGKSAEDIRQFVVRCGYDSFSDLLKKQKQDQKKTL